MNKVLKWLEDESDRLTEESLSSADPHKTVNNSFLEGFNYALANVQGLAQPQLNENQQMVLDELKVNTDYHKFNKFQAVYWMLTNFINYPDTLMAKAYKRLTQNELEQVFQVFSQWTLEQEEE